MKHLATLFARTTFNFSSGYKTLVINHNLKFDAKDHELFLIPSHPKIIARGFNAVEVDNQVPVVELALVKKPSADEDFSKNWKQRAHFEFTFNQLHTLLDLQAKSGSTASFKMEKQGKSIEIVDKAEDGEVRLQYRQGKGKEAESTAVSANISCEDFELIQDIIKESLYDLSGLRFQLESRRQEEVTAALKQLNTQKERQDETQSFYKQ